jgi:hypothetical protein
MTDDKTERGPQDRSRINLSEDYGVRDWTQALGVSEQDLRDAVERAGGSADAVRRELGGR